MAKTKKSNKIKKPAKIIEFFRNADAFETLKKSVFPQLMKNAPPGTPLRIWMPGCSTGEDVYYLAILLIEYVGHTALKIPIQILATDINETAIQKARAGIYSEKIARSLGKERINSFFQKVESGFKINKAIRDLCLFSKHDVTNDPPFSKVDLVFFQAKLTSFSPSLQDRIISIFHYALNPGGVLLLSSSESQTLTSNFFSALDKTSRIFSRTNGSTSMNFRFSAKASKLEVLPKSPSEPANADTIALLKYAPPSVVVNSEMEILQFRGRTFPFLVPAAGVPTHSLLKMTKKELLQDLRNTLQEAIKKNTAVRKEGISFGVARRQKLVNIEVIPVDPLLPPSARTFVIFFESAIESTPSKSLTTKKKRSKVTQDKQGHLIVQLEQELSAGKLSQLSLAEEFDAAQEELTTAIEELQSTNEELHSTNEELATAKEEIQSSCEELTTVNDELQIRNTDLNTISSDLENVLNSAEIPILIVGNDHCIRRFTPKTQNYFKLIPSDLGRPIGDIKSELNLDFQSLIKEVTDSLKPQEKEIKDRQGRWVRLQIRPYKTIDNRIDGAVITLVDIEALKQQVEASKKAQDYLTSVSETVAVPLLLLDDQLRMRSANRAFWENFKLSQNIIGKDFFEALEIQSDPLLSTKRLLTEMLRTKTKIKNVEMICEFPLIGRRTLLISASLIQWVGEMSQESQESQESQAILLSFDDITEQKEHQAALRRSELRYRALFDSIDEGFCVIEKIEGPPENPLDFRHIETNPAYEVQSGVVGVVGKTIRQVIPSESEEWIQIYDTILKTGEPKRFERLLVSKSKVLELYAFRVDDETQSRVAIIFRDITARKHEDQLKGLFSAIVDSSDDAIISKDLNDIITSWNKSANRLFGYSADEVIGRHISILIPTDRPTENVDILERFNRGERLERFESVRRRKDGSTFDVALTISPVISSKGEILGLSEVARDISAEKCMQAALAQLLAKEQNSRAEAEEANKTKDDFIATLSHELRTPLTSILSWSQLIQTPNFSPDKIKLGMRMIEQSAKMQSQLINDLLDVTRIRSGKLSITFSEVDPKDSVRVAIQAVHTLAENKQIILQSEIKLQSEKIWGDRDRLKQIICNLLTNAIKFSNNSGVITVLVEAVEEHGDQFASIKVIDQGKGILPEFLPKLFDRFSQADSSSVRVHGGLGLGLSIVRDLVQLQNGTVRAESEGLGKGATFTVLFPMRSGAGGLQNKTALIVEDRMSELEPANLSGLRVLVVEDDPSALEVLVEALNSFGAKTLPCGTVGEAVAAFKNFRPNVLISDISIPGEDGYSLIRKIRKLGPQQQGDVPSLALTAFATKGDVQRALSAGFDAHMAKPFDTFRLAHMVAELAQKKVTSDSFKA